MTRRSISVLLGTISDELAACAEIASTLQSEISDETKSHPDINAMQSLDLLTQTLGCLADFTAAAGQSTRADVLVPLDHALSRVNLGELSRRLSGLPRTSPVSGDIAVFD